MSDTDTLTVKLSLEQLSKSERGRGALLSLSEFLWQPCSTSLDTSHQHALARLFILALHQPEAREAVQRAAFDERGGPVKGRRLK